MIKDEVGCGERSRIDPMQRDRLTVAEGDYRVAVGIVGGVGLDVAEAGEASIADEIDLIVDGIVVVDRVVTDRLREHELIVAAGAGQGVIA